MSNSSYKILVICMGNICRSPTAEAVLKKKVRERGLNVFVDSAGTISYHTGSMPDPRSVAAGEGRGYDFSGITARSVKASDFEVFDKVLVADRNNLEDVLSICPPALHHKIALFLSYGEGELDEIPDPYYGGARGFEYVLDVVEDAADCILDSIQTTL
ncbi:low molecular weight protein-tyrosine-phosphatase [Photobacterium sanguinicancri]|uniref:Protein-tyrosine-phosphatase n=1 Tax=Photobacterium sanguinicancri TaxID=875932 RepID=A0ABX4G456_9GAMM|nr:low molecular weight protein-tyrosine-phosphatase [Photobacterium sanguinicancri]MDO6497252.1 low molecular weight protein-tyrosine-phosphatase [Photobacterium sanguinicancri]OZS45781.1 protein-tyrosine-phosphatase [Photobacterium sanguinicancri]